MNERTWTRSRGDAAWFPVALLTIFLSACAANTMDRPSGPPLTGDEISKLIVGNTVNGAVGASSFSYFYKDVVSVSGTIGQQGDDDSGTWTIKGNDVYCNTWIDFFDGVERCYRWYRTERGYIMENVDAYHLRPLIVYSVEKGNPLGF